MSNAALWISDPGAVSRLPRWVGRLLDTHPPIEQRIAWLRTLEGANALWADLP
jgi:Zn-dependent protease with chaperone function